LPADADHIGDINEMVFDAMSAVKTGRFGLVNEQIDRLNPVSFKPINHKSAYSGQAVEQARGFRQRTTYSGQTGGETFNLCTSA
jgi:hypothetical protein